MSANDELQAHTCEKMLEFYGNVANNVAQGNSQDLTEQWKKGELSRDRYYIKYRGNYISDNWHGDCWEDSWSEYVEEVLAPVPSYDNWVYLHKARNDAHEKVESLTQENKQLRKWCEEFNAIDVAEENKELKELLKRCVPFVQACQYNYYRATPEQISSFLDRINEMLGEKK